MKIIGANLYSLRIPFVESFSHAAHARAVSDSIVVRVRSEDGVEGYGEGVPRPYVTGETVETCLQSMRDQFWPVISRADYPQLTASDILCSLKCIDESFAEINADGVIAGNAARTAFELALIDCLLKHQSLSLAALLPPRREEVIYSGVITLGSKAKMVELARRFKELGITQIKVKIDGGDDRAKLLAIREAAGGEVSLRVDANSAFTLKQAVAVLNDISEAKIDCIEQPLPRGNISELAQLRTETSIPVMVDESLVTISDAERLIAAGACDFFNLRISKNGGIYQTVRLARMAENAGIRLQLGAQVGETAILSAAGRHLAAYLNPVFVEGSFGTMLLAEDVADVNINFGYGGSAPVLHGNGLGINIRNDVLAKYAVQIIECGRRLS